MSAKFDASIIAIMRLLLENKNNEISGEQCIPLSTVQQMVRNLFSPGVSNIKVPVNYPVVYFKSALLYIYIKYGDIQETAQKISIMDKVVSSEIHIRNSDFLGNVIYKDTKDLQSLISSIKDSESVDKIARSERVYENPPSKELPHLGELIVNRESQ